MCGGAPMGGGAPMCGGDSMGRSDGGRGDPMRSYDPMSGGDTWATAIIGVRRLTGSGEPAAMRPMCRSLVPSLPFLLRRLRLPMAPDVGALPQGGVVALAGLEVWL